MLTFHNSTKLYKPFFESDSKRYSITLNMIFYFPKRSFKTLNLKFWGMKLYIWSFTTQNFKFEVSYFYLHFGLCNYTSYLWFINILFFIVLILIKIISHKYLKFCLQNLSLHIKLNKTLEENLKYLKLDLDNKKYTK